MRKQSKLVVTTAKTLLFIVALIGLVLSSRNGLASLEFYSVNNMLEQWQEDESKAEKQLNEALLNTLKANSLHPSHPMYIDILGQLNEWTALSVHSGDEQLNDKNEQLEKAKTFYRSAILQRPTWPVTHASLLIVKWRMAEFDEEMVSAISNAIKFGPKKPEVHLALIQFGLASYQSNHPFYAHVRAVLPEYIELGMRNKLIKAQVLSTIQRYDAKRTSCRWLSKLANTDRFPRMVSLRELNCEA
ncbi:hypothetical protein ISG33_15880 [Glaciecola sp. MH2013]|uniref:VpsP family polysaccharide biosynthesis protein n=1 Tax=Glaciecola sp. MH2013 TaxID=2785524 RepID=UPI00189D93DC|nr:VpsP family polysaccharide biosynthesis protein [Glaciecola sp. MH2013]MBF7074882.1 hypothetical protein [Glaciecola sp. MH2013]